MKQWQDKVELKIKIFLELKIIKEIEKNKISVGHSDVNASDTGKYHVCPLGEQIRNNALVPPRL
jgi:hypothetical protein